MDELIAGIAIGRREPIQRFDELAAYVKYAGELRSTLMAGEPSQAAAGEDAAAILLEAHEDGTWTVGVEIVWADACRGHWVAVSRPEDAPTPWQSIVRITEADGTWARAVEAPALLERARWLGVARRAWWSRLARRPEAEESLADAAIHLPDVAWVHVQHGMALLSIDDADAALAALAAFERARGLGEDAPTDRARALLSLDRPAEALEAVADENDVRGLCVRGRALRALGRAEEAVEVLRAALNEPVAAEEGHAAAWVFNEARHENVHALARLTLGESLFDLARFSEAADVLAASSSEKARLVHAACYERLERTDDAIAAYSGLVRDFGSEHGRERLQALMAARALRSRGRTTRADSSIDIGCIVEHAKLGRGEVIDVEDGRVTQIVVMFESVGEKTLAASFVKVISR